MPQINSAVVTGAFSYTGRYIAKILIQNGVNVSTLTRHTDTHNYFDGKIKSAPLDFTDRDRLAKSLQGADVLFNTYWVRFERGDTTFEGAIRNSKILFDAAREAGVSKIVHISVAKPSPNTHLPYFSGKWRVEEALKECGVSYAIFRPTVTFGIEDILINNIAYALRRYPLFPVLGDGNYEVQPIFIEDLATQVVEAASSDDSITADSAGPDKMSFNDLLNLLADKMGVKARLLHTPPSIGLALTSIVGLIVRDVVLTRNEVDGLMSGLLASETPPYGTTKLSDWLTENADSLGRAYQSELKRNFNFKN